MVFQTAHSHNVGYVAVGYHILAVVILLLRRSFVTLYNMITKFKAWLAKQDLAENSVTSYVWTVNYFLREYQEVKRGKLLAYKGYLVENFKPLTVNLRLQAINKYLEFLKQD